MAACFGHLNQRQKRPARSRVTVLFALLLLSFSTLHAQSSKYKVLLIGNNAYVKFPDLGGAPIKDVDALDQVLMGLGFAEGSITVAKNQTHQQFLTTLTNFRAKLNDDDAVLFYYSGHGFSIGGDDYLAPVDFSFGETKDEAKRQSIGVAQVVAFLATIKSRVIVLDACRTEASRLKQMVNKAPKVELDALISSRLSGSLIAYSTSAQKVSSARSASGLSFYTQYLVNSLAARPKDMYTALLNAKSATSIASGESQVPAIYDEMVGSFVFSNEQPSPNHHQMAHRTDTQRTRIHSVAAGTATIIAPRVGLQNYTVIRIDTREFERGGTLVIEIDISRTSRTDGSFDLFPENVAIPTHGRPTGSVASRYDVRRGSSTRLEYRFARGQIFALGLEGNWYSPPGATGTVNFRASVID